jgi:hypothetical protein
MAPGVTVISTPPSSTDGSVPFGAWIVSAVAAPPAGAMWRVTGPAALSATTSLRPSALISMRPASTPGSCRSIAGRLERRLPARAGQRLGTDRELHRRGCRDGGQRTIDGDRQELAQQSDEVGRRGRTDILRGRRQLGHRSRNLDGAEQVRHQRIHDAVAHARLEHAPQRGHAVRRRSGTSRSPAPMAPHHRSPSGSTVTQANSYRARPTRPASQDAGPSTASVGSTARPL